MMESPMLSGSCRCCASEGAYKDVKSSYHWMGEEEIYADMLKDCFDISLSSPSDGQEEGGICEICITQLRNAANFRKQVLHTEEQFKNRLQIGIFKPELVKVEIPGEDENDSDDNNASADEVYSGPEFEVPIKSESPEEPKPKKRAAKKATTTRAKKAKTDDAETSTKRIQRKPVTEIDNNTHSIITIKKILIGNTTITKINKVKQLMETSNLEKHRSNIRIIMQCSNATPIRSYDGIGYTCCFCAESFPDPADLKRHTIEKHDDTAKRNIMQRKDVTSFLVKLDITSLKCSICDTSIETLELLIKHLVEVHEKQLNTKIKNQIVPFKFNDDVLRCMYCRNIFYKFRCLLQHMNSHIRNYICNVCDAGFANKRNLLNHKEVHKVGSFKCSHCPKVFNTRRKKNSHEKVIHKHSSLVCKCNYCDEKFTHNRRKDRHMMAVHGVQIREINCQACDKTFPNTASLTKHTKKVHLMERSHGCDQCEMAFFTKRELSHHMLKHTGKRQFQCDICKKTYIRKFTLREHMRIHNNDRRFRCRHCDQTFVQKCSWIGHMRTKHGDVP